MSEANRPTILVLIKGLGLGGAERLIADGAQFWDRDRFDYHVAYVLPWKDHLVPDLEARKVPVHFVGTARGLTPRAVPGIKTLMRQLEVDLVHAHLPTMGIIGRLVSKAPTVYTEHNMPSSYRALTRLLNRITYSWNRAVIAVSQAVADELASYPGPAPRVIPNGVSCHVDLDEAVAVRRELGLNDDDPLVVHVGNIRPGKGHDVLVEATALLNRQIPEATVVSIGAEKYSGDLDRLRGAAHTLGLDGRIRFLGRRDDALAFVSAADVFVNPSEVEGLPLAVLEALALGRPVVATRAGGVPGVIEDQRTGLLVEPRSPAALAEAVERLIREQALARRLGAEGRALVEKEYGLAKMVRAVEEVYEEVLGAR